MIRSTMRSYGFATCVVLVAVVAAGCTSTDAKKRKFLEAGQALASQKKYDEAIVQFRNAVVLDQRFGEARWRLAEAYQASGDVNNALQEYIRAADLLPDNVEVQVTAATYLLGAQRFLDARSRAESVLAKDPQNAEALIIRATATAELKDVNGAIKDMEEAAKLHGDDGRMYTSLGAMRASQGNRVEAEAMFKRAVQVSPKSVGAKLALANFYLSTDRSAEAEGVLNEARALEPTNLLANRMLAGFYISHQRPNEAEGPLKVVAGATDDPAAKVSLADYYMLVSRPADAAGVLKPLTEGAKPYSPAVIRLAQIHRDADRKDEAGKLLAGVLEREPRNADALTTQSIWALQDGNTDAAVTAGRAAVAANSESALAHLSLGRALIAKRDSDGAIKALNEATRLNPQLAVAQVLLSQLQFATGDTAAALEHATVASQSAPGAPAVRVAKARGLLAQGRTADAEPEVKALLAVAPRDAGVHALNGMLLMAKKDAAGSRAAFNRALDIDPISPDALQGLLLLDGNSGQLAAAVRRIDDRLASHPKNAPLWFIAGRTYGAAGQADKAEKAFKTGLDLDPSNLDAYNYLGRIFTSTGRLDQALQEFSKAAVQHPSNVGPATMVATILEMQGKRAEARKQYEAIVGANPRAAVAANNLAWMMAQDGGNLDLALQHAQAAKAELPNSPDVNDTLAWIYYKRDLPQMAIPLLEESVARDPKNAGYQMHLGLAYAKAGQVERAKASLQSSLALKPNQPEADEARKVLNSPVR